jgi:hypothetical protein
VRCSLCRGDLISFLTRGALLYIMCGRVLLYSISSGLLLLDEGAEGAEGRACVGLGLGLG